MKRYIPILVLLLASLAPAQPIILNPVSGAGTAFVTGNLVSEWNFVDDGSTTLVDQVGTNDGTVSGMAWVTAGGDFADDNDQVTGIAAGFNPNVTAFTLSVVVNRTIDITGSPDVIFAQDDGGGTGRVYIRLNTSEEMCTFLQALDNCRTGTLSSGWHYLTVSYNAGTVSLYVDGGTATTFSVTPEGTTGDLRFGNTKLQAEDWEEEIGYALLYDDELTAAENFQNCEHAATIMSGRGVTMTSCVSP